MSYEGTFEEAAAELAGALQRSVDRCVEGHEKVAVAFSGGVDSSVIVACARKRTDVVACSAFTEASLDRKVVRAAAESLGVVLVSETLTRETIAEALGKMSVPFEPSAMDKSLWSIYSVVARNAAGVGSGTLLLGQLADELFGGYAKYQRAMSEKGNEKARALMADDFTEYEKRGKLRDVAACSKWVLPQFPFEGAEVRKLAESLPLSYKIRGQERKAVLRRASVMLGVPESLSDAPKKAAQYSSGVQRVILGSRF